MAMSGGSGLQDVLDWKEKGNAKLKADDKDAACECYSRGIEIGVNAISKFQGMAEDFEPLKKAVSQVLSNRGHVRLAQGLPKLALQDCQRSAEIDFLNTKAYWRGVSAALQLEEQDEDRLQAAELLREGLRLAFEVSGGSALSKLLGENLGPCPGCCVFSASRVQHICYLLPSTLRMLEPHSEEHMRLNEGAILGHIRTLRTAELPRPTRANHRALGPTPSRDS